MSTLSFPVKTLFIDEPFMEEDTLRAKRSRFIWNIIAEQSDADLLLLKSDKHREQPVAKHFGYDRLYSLSLDTAKHLLPSGYHQLAKGQGKRFSGILDGKRYQLIVMAGLKCLSLCYLARKALPHCVIVTDIDRLYLPEIKQHIKGGLDMQNLSQVWDLLRQNLLDKFLLRSSLRYTIADPGFISKLNTHTSIPESAYLHLPLPFEPLPEPLESVPIRLPASKFILFWGDAKLSANINAAKLVASDIYPRISKKLVEKDISIVICGDEAYRNYCGGRLIYAPAEDLPALLPKALFVLLPIFEPDSEGRIYRCAQHHQALLCAPETLLSIPLPVGSHYQAPDPDSFANVIGHLLRAPRELEKTGQQLLDICQATFAAPAIKESLLDKLKIWMGTDASQ